MPRKAIQYTVMFADVAGSTALYEKYGNRKAKNTIDTCLNLMTDITNSQKGKVIKTIGDEVMCRFSTATDCMWAAVKIQEAVKNKFNNAKEIPLKIRIGLHTGDAILDKNDLFGDAVNVAARMANIAKADQIITSTDTYNHLTGFLKSLCRKYDSTPIKGKSGLITIYDVLWDDEDDDVTRITHSATAASGDKLITLTTTGQNNIFHEQDTPVTLGRGAQTSIHINTPFVSRIHASIAYNRGKFVLTDQSTNGTYVRLSDGKEFFLRREELPLSSSGSIALGEKVEECSTVILFAIS